MEIHQKFLAEIFKCEKNSVIDFSILPARVVCLVGSRAALLAKGKFADKQIN